LPAHGSCGKFAGVSFPLLLLLAIVAAANVAFCIAWWRARRHYPGRKRTSPQEVLIGFGVSFLDALGIGSFAPTTAILKLRGDPPDELIPGTLNVGLNAPAAAEVLIFVTTVAVSPVLLTTMVLSSALGAWLGAGIVSRMPRRAIQLFMGAALLIASGVFAAANLKLLPTGGTALFLTGWKFGLAIAVNFVLGALMSAGIGLYAPCMIMLALMGLNPLSAFPIMMGSCSLVQPIASLKFFRTHRFAFGTALGLAIGGIGGVLVAVYLVRQLPLEALRWLVFGVVLYAATSMLRSYAAGRARAAA
jgi:uncharacterized membrane protein YfcA